MTRKSTSYCSREDTHAKECRRLDYETRALNIVEFDIEGRQLQHSGGGRHIDYAVPTVHPDSE
ncbi:MAG: hypothetical protein JJ913_02210 [Rhizobiaceae bacterium]|nr:hypothetical protein [Rhizobiaceae bacterium]